jgi:hypothetical protein
MPRRHWGGGRAVQIEREKAATSAERPSREEKRLQTKGGNTRTPVTGAGETQTKHIQLSRF